MMIDKKLISVVIPIYNEQENISIVYDTISQVLQDMQQSYDYELIFINDGSKDCSWKLLKTLAATDECVRVFSFSRNFGHQAALTAGYDKARGDCVISMDADMQDPPSLITKMINKWESGAQIVYARRINRKDGILKKCTAYCFYRLLSAVSDAPMPRNVGDFRLIDKKVLAVINSCREKARYLRGMVAWSGFAHAYIDFCRPNRHAGTTGYTWKKMCKLALDGLTSFSSFPLRLAAYIGVLIICFGTATSGYVLYKTFVAGVVYGLAVWLAQAVIFMIGVQCLLLWLLGEYVGRMYEQQQQRPLYIIVHQVDDRLSVKTAGVRKKQKQQVTL